MRIALLAMTMMLSASAAAEGIEGLWSTVNDRGQTEYRAIMPDRFQKLKFVRCAEALGDHGAAIVCADPTEPGNLFLENEGSGKFRISTPGHALTSILLEGNVLKVSGPWGIGKRQWTRSHAPVYFLPKGFAK